RLGPELGLAIESTVALGPALAVSDVCVTCTTARAPVLGASDVVPGTFVAAVGADNPHKQELEPALLARAPGIVDSRVQTAHGGELHHALVGGVLDQSSVVEIADVVAGTRPGRRSRDEIAVFDSTGVALEDVAAALVVHERAQGIVAPE